MKHLWSAIFGSTLVAFGDAVRVAGMVEHPALGITCSDTDRTRRIEKGSLAFDSLPGARFKLGGLVGERVEANVENWLLRAPQSNPGMLEMFRLRDRQPAPQLVPWAEYFQCPRPRWESLHDLQGLVELWRIIGEAKYRDAFIHHWRSIRRWDRRNTGAFSSGEQATGNPYAPTAIETCCTVAWMTLTADYLRLSGDPLAADDLELATFNGGLGAQHPSGRWFQWREPRGFANLACHLELAADPGFSKILLRTNSPAHGRLDLDMGVIPSATGTNRWWRVVTRSPGGDTAPDVPPSRFTLSADAPAQVLPPEAKLGPDGEIMVDALHGEEPPKLGSSLRSLNAPMAGRRSTVQQDSFHRNL